MIGIAILDTDRKESNTLAGILKSLFKEKGVSVRIDVFEDSPSFTSEYTVRQYELVLLASDLEKIDGMTPAKWIHEHGFDTDIIYCTEERENAVNFEMTSLGFLMKPYEVLEVNRLVDYFSYRRNLLYEQAVAVTSNFLERRIRFREIIYIESMDKVVLFHTVRGEDIKVYDKLSNIEKKLEREKRFLRCHQSFIINMDYVGCMFENEFITITNNYIPIRRRERKQIKERYYEYMKN